MVIYLIFVLVMVWGYLLLGEIIILNVVVGLFIIFIGVYFLFRKLKGKILYVIFVSNK